MSLRAFRPPTPTQATSHKPQMPPPAADPSGGKPSPPAAKGPGPASAESAAWTARPGVCARAVRWVGQIGVPFVPQTRPALTQLRTRRSSSPWSHALMKSPWNV